MRLPTWFCEACAAADLHVLDEYVFHVLTGRGVFLDNFPMVVVQYLLLP